MMIMMLRVTRVIRVSGPSQSRRIIRVSLAHLVTSNTVLKENRHRICPRGELHPMQRGPSRQFKHKSQGKSQDIGGTR